MRDRVGMMHNLRTAISDLIESKGAFRNCATCSYWLHPHGCDKFKQMPPQEIIAKGCDDHSDLIPF